MKHLQFMIDNLPEDKRKFVKIAKGKKGKGHSLSITVQSDPVSEVGVNGIQASDMLSMSKFLIQSLDSAFPCADNKATIISIEEAEFFQARRTRDREARGVEGKNEA